MNTPQQQQNKKPPRRKSRYGTQLEEKQNLKNIYGIRERQLARYFSEARKGKKETGPLMIELLESRLDNAIYRAGIAKTRSQARQMASHRLFTVNKKAVDVPSYRLQKGDVVSAREGKRKVSYFKNFEKRMQNAEIADWLQVDVKDYSFKLVAMPDADNAKLGVDTQAIVELLSR